MSKYTPHNWVIVEFTIKGETLRRVIGGWSGGYLDGDNWRISSGITNVEEEGDFVLITNHSGSLYKCLKSGQGTSGAMRPILYQLEKYAEENEDMSYRFIEWGGV